MLTIRFSRVGKKNKPMYRLIISEKTKDPYGKSLEILGSYNPYTKELVCKEDRIKHWISVGSGVSPSVNNLLVEKGIIKEEKKKTFKINTKKQLKKREDKVKGEKDKKDTKETEEKKDDSSSAQESAQGEALAETPVEAKAETVSVEAPVEEKKEEKKEEVKAEDIKEDASVSEAPVEEKKEEASV